MHTIDLEPYQHSDTRITGIRLIDPESPYMEHLTNFFAEDESERDNAEEEAEADNTDENIEPGNDDDETETCKMNMTSFLLPKDVVFS